MKRAGWIVITDLDGCLLDPLTYDWKAHAAALGELRRRRIPVVFCTSKTRAETEAIRREIGNTDPFIVENGGAVVLADRTIVLGTPYPDIVSAFRRLQQRIPARGFCDRTAEEIGAECGLSPERARLAKQREYDEPFTSEGDPVPIARELGLRCSRGGRFWHLHGDTDKGRAVLALREWAGRVRMLGIGDSANDQPMLAAVDVACAVRKPDGRWDDMLTASLPRLRCVDDWSSTVRSVLSPG